MKYRLRPTLVSWMPSPVTLFAVPALALMIGCMPAGEPEDPIDEGGAEINGSSQSLTGTGSLKILTVGANLGHRATQSWGTLDWSGTFENSHPGSTVAHVSELTFNTMSTSDLSAYDVVLTQWASSPWLNLSSAAVKDYVANGGGLILDGDFNNFNDLGWVGITGASGYCSGWGTGWTLNTAGVADGFQLSAGLGSHPSLANCHGSFPNYDATVFAPFLSDNYGNKAGLAGQYGAGRIILTGPDQDYHAHPTGEKQQFQLLLNELEWAAGSCADDDADGVCNATDACPNDPDNDADGDGVCGDVDNCPADANADQADLDGDGMGDVCDPDDDNDGVNDADDNCPVDANSDQADFDGDGMGDACDPDDDNDGVNDSADYCPGTVTDPAAGVPSDHLGPNRWALLDLSSGEFSNGAIPGGGNGPGLSFSIQDTGGCSCAQIIEELSLGHGHEKFGCSNSAMLDWVESLGN